MRARRDRGQRGQALVEYALITATVVTSFALASRMGVSSAFMTRLNESQSNYSVLIPQNLDDLKESIKQDKFNREITLH